jgi:N-acetylated-alpha-linked acidic dipeptidase
LKDGTFKAIYDPRRPTVAPPVEDIPPYLNFAPLENALDALNKSAEHYKAASNRAETAGFAGSAKDLSALNEKLIQSERRLTDPAGLPRRPWYKHIICAPGVYTGYDAKTMPGIREGIELRHWQEADAEIGRVAKVLQAEAALIDSASADLERLGH